MWQTVTTVTGAAFLLCHEQWHLGGEEGLSCLVLSSRGCIYISFFNLTKLLYHVAVDVTCSSCSTWEKYLCSMSLSCHFLMTSKEVIYLADNTIFVYLVIFPLIFLHKTKSIHSSWSLSYGELSISKLFFLHQSPNFTSYPLNPFVFWFANIFWASFQCQRSWVWQSTYND